MTGPQFILEEKINEGATTTVYRAHQSVLGRTVLLKILHKHLIGDTVLVERFRREARACALIRSEYIVQVFDLTEIDGAPAIVMEYVEGTSLKDVLAAEGPMAPARARQVVIETLSALRAAHERGVIHRDIKPGNILLTEAGRVKVTDFGLAAISVSQTVTMEGAVLGTPAYLPPEHIRGEAADERSDLFSLGATYIELLTGQRIFEGSSYSACINKIMQFTTGSVDALITDAESAEVIKKLMHPDRQQRFASAAAALDAMNATPEPAPATRPAEGSAGPQPQPPARRAAAPHRYVRMAIAAMLLGFSALAAASLWFMLRSDESATEKRTSSPQAVAQDSLQTAPATTPASTPGVKEALSKENTAAASGALPHAVPPGSKPGEKDSTGLVITCTPWGKIYLDNQYLGETPLSGAVTVRSGPHTINFTNPEFTPIVKSVTAAPGAQLTVAANFFENAGYLVVTVNPWAEIYIDDLYRDTTPREKPFIVTAGRRKIRLHNPRFTDVTADIVVPKNDTLRLSYTLTGTR